MWIAQQVTGVGEPAVELSPDAVESVWSVGPLLVLVAAALAVAWLAWRGVVVTGVAERTGRRSGWSRVAAVAAAFVAVSLLAHAFGFDLPVLWLRANAFLGAPLTVLIVAVGAYRLGQLHPQRLPAPHPAHERP